jgi:PAS domain S-box-containing protein
MSWVTVIWSIGGGACLTLALINFVVWCNDRAARANLVFAVMATAVAVLATLELAMMRAETPAQFGIAARWLHAPAWVIVASLVGFVRLYLRAGRRWLAWTIVGVRTVSLILNFIFSPNINYREITALRHVSFLGEPVSVAAGVPNPLMLVAQLSLLLLIIFVTDATITVWRRGDRRQALMVGGSILLFVTGATADGVAIGWGIISMPVSVSLFYQGIVAAMACELSYDVLHAAAFTRRLQASEAALRESEVRINLAVNAANLGLWLWNIPGDELWVTEKWRELFGFADSEPVTFARLLQVVHPEDREHMKQLVQHMFERGGEYESEYRIIRPDASTRWIAGYGSVELDEHGKPAFARGVSRDVTKRKIAEEELRESEARFRTVADAAPVLIWMSGVDKLCNFFNKPWLEFTGRTIEQEMGNGWAEGVHPDDLQRCLQIYNEAFDARQPFVMQYRLRRHDGEYRWISDNGVPRYDAVKNFTGYIGSCVDVTELKSKEQALRESEERMSLAMDAAKLGLWEWNVSKDELWGTQARRMLLGLPASEKIKLEDALSRVHADDRDRVRQMLKDAARTGKDYHHEYRVVLPDGSVRWTEHRGRCVRGADGKDLVLRGVSIDVTEQKRAEEKFRLAVEASPSGILLVNQTGQIVLVNSHIEELFGYGREELLGHSVEILVPERFAGQHPADRAEFLAAPTARAMGVGRELFGRRKDGSEFPVEIGLSPIQTPEGMLVLAAVVDISARKLAEAEAVQRREEVGHLSRVAVMGELTASMAHELNQPLSGIISNASAGQRFIDRGNVDPRELRELLADIVADGRRAGEVIRGIRNMVKKGSQVRHRVNLNDLVTNVVRMVKSDAMLRSCDLDTLLEPDLPSIEGDPIQLQQVLLNLLINAFDAMRDTPLSRRKVVIVTERNGDSAIRASVRDYGTGIAAEARDRLFDHFFTTKPQGLGMGLAIVRSIVESHFGTIASENVEGGGARFHFTLPVSPERATHSAI